MSWQDRDYAHTPPRARSAWSVRAPTTAWGGSIVTILIAANVAVFVLSSSLFPPLRRFFFGFGELQAKLVVEGQLWRLFTAQYLHANMWHIAFNMIGLHFLGRPMERYWSQRKFFTIYTLCGLVGNIFFTILFASDPIRSMIPAVGASGCIFGLLGVVAVMFPTATVYIWFLFPLKIRTAAMIFAGIAVLSILQKGANWGGEACHLAGLVFGVWWAVKGDAWWSRKSWPQPGGKGPKRSRVRRARKEGFAHQMGQRRADAETVDTILKKVYDRGIHSLTEAEKRALQEATERQRRREADSERIDRL